MASRREIKLQNQVLFRDEKISDLKNRSDKAWEIIKDIFDKHEAGDDIDSKLAKALNILAEHEAI
jgi:ribosomal protein L31E